jgi:hypothetical protein
MTSFPMMAMQSEIDGTSKPISFVTTLLGSSPNESLHAVEDSKASRV